MTLGDGILWSTVLILFAAGIYLLSVKRKWKTFGKVLAVVILIGAVIGGGIWSYIKWKDRPYVVTEYYGIELGMRPVDVTLIKGHPLNMNDVQELRERPGTYYLVFLYQERERGDQFLIVVFEGETSESVSVIRVCREGGGYDDLLGFGPYAHEKNIVEKLGEPTQISINENGTSKWINYEKWNVAYEITERNVDGRCMATSPMSYKNEYGKEPDPE